MYGVTWTVEVEFMVVQSQGSPAGDEEDAGAQGILEQVPCESDLRRGQGPAPGALRQSCGLRVRLRGCRLSTKYPVLDAKRERWPSFAIRLACLTGRLS